MSGVTPEPPQRITKYGFQVTTGVFTAIALILAAGRTYIRITQTRKISIDDGFFYLAVAALIAGTTACYFDINYIYVPQNVDPATFQITPEFLDFLQQSLTWQALTCFLLSVALFAVKLSFLTFFRDLLRRVRGLMIFWWCVLCFMVPVAIIFACIIFIICPYFDERVLAFLKQNRLLQTATVLDIFTDILRKSLLLLALLFFFLPLMHGLNEHARAVIIIPVALLWRVRISLRRKLILMFVLGLSIFTIILSIVRIAGGRQPNGGVDSAWVNFWLQLEADVAVMIISITSYRSLFVKDKSSKDGGNKKSPRYHGSEGYRKKLWSRSGEKGGEGGGGGGKGRKGVEMPTLPDPTLSGMRTVIGRGRGAGWDDDDGRFSRSEEMFLPRATKGIVVTREADVWMVC
ncbi:MAG: hypothetical protein Q9169_002927 [Polycauliona sp. 2 TL-2023]